MAGKKATVMHSYDAEQDGELSLTVGDVIYVMDQVTLLTYMSTELSHTFICLLGFDIHSLSNCKAI